MYRDDEIYVCDLHCDTISELYKKKGKAISLRKNDLSVDINKLAKGNYLVQVFAVFVNFSYKNRYRECRKIIKFLKKEIKKNNEFIKIAYSYQDFLNNTQKSKMSAFISIEDGGILGNNLKLLQKMYKKGVRIITLTWNYENEIGYGASSVNVGIKKYGFEFIKEMEKLKMIIDVSHLSDRGFYDVYNNTTRPLISSHSNCRSICNNKRNLTDDMIIKIHKRGGLIGINYFDEFVNEGDSFEKIYVYAKDIVKHINHIKEIASIDCISLGSDFDGIKLNNEIDRADKIYILKKELIKSGYTIDEIKKIFYENFVRLISQCLN